MRVPSWLIAKTSPAVAFAPNKWHHLVITRDGTTQSGSIYINGVKDIITYDIGGTPYVAGEEFPFLK